MTDTAVTTSEVAVPQGHDVDKVVTKTTLDNGEKRVLEAAVAIPQQPALLSILSGDDAALIEQVVECHALGMCSRIRNHLNAGRTEGLEVVTPADVVRMTAEAAASKATQGDGLRLFRQAIEAVMAVAEASGYSAAACGKIKKLVSNPTALSMASQGHKARIIQLLEAVGAALPEDQLAEISAPLEKILTAAQTEEDDDDFI